MLAQVDFATLDLAGKLDVLQRQINGLTAAMLLAKQAGNQAAVDGLRQQFLNTTALARQLRAEANAADAPSTFMTQLDKFSDTAIAVGRNVFGVAADFGKGLGGTAKILPFLLLGAIAVLGIVGVGYVRHGGVRIRRS